MRKGDVVKVVKGKTLVGKYVMVAKVFLDGSLAAVFKEDERPADLPIEFNAVVLEKQNVVTLSRSEQELLQSVVFPDPSQIEV